MHAHEVYKGRTRNGGTAQIGFAGTPLRGGGTSARAEETTATQLEKIPSRGGQGTGSRTEHLHLWTRRQAPDPRPVALVRETDRNTNGAARSMCGGRADHHDDQISSEQGEFPETPTGDGRRCLHHSDGSKTLTTVLVVLGSSRRRSTGRILSRMWEPGGGWPQQGVETSNPEVRDKLPREQSMASGQKRRWESAVTRRAKQLHQIVIAQKLFFCRTCLLVISCLFLSFSCRTGSCHFVRYLEAALW